MSAAFNEMLAFIFQRLGFRHNHRLTLKFIGRGHLAIGPRQILAIDDQLFRPRLGIIKNRNARRADHGQFLFLEGVKPADKNMGANSGAETHGGKRGVGHSLVQIFTAAAPHLVRHLAAGE